MRIDTQLGDPYLEYPAPPGSNEGSRGVGVRFYAPRSTSLAREKRSIESPKLTHNVGDQEIPDQPHALSYSSSSELAELSKVVDSSFFEHGKTLEARNSKDVITFEFCTKNWLEQHLWLGGFLLTNPNAALAWTECRSSRPILAGPKSTMMCGRAAYKIMWVGYDCYHSLDYWLDSKIW